MGANISFVPDAALTHDGLLPAAPETVTDIAELLVAYLEQIGVEFVFGVRGGIIDPLYNAIARNTRRGGLRRILARHETGAVYMADGYARETGKPGVCCATSGPGATNLITGVACAYDNGIPLLVLTGQPSLSVGKRALPEPSFTAVNAVSMLRHCTRYNSLISHPAQLEPKLIAALMRANRSPRGPVHLSIPLDILKSSSPVAKPSYDLRRLLLPSSMMDDGAVESLHQLILKANNIVLLIGAGCGEAAGAVLRFAAMTGAKFVTTPDGKGLVNPRHPLYRGVFGNGGHSCASEILRDASTDLIVAIGAGMGDMSADRWSECDSLLNRRLVHIDDSEDRLMLSPMARLHVRGRILTIFDRLIALLHRSSPLSSSLSSPTSECISEFESKAGVDADANAAWLPGKCANDATPITPQRLMWELGEAFPSNTCYLADTGNCLAWAIHYLNPRDKQIFGRRPAASVRKNVPLRGKSDGGWLRVVMNFAPMGWAIGAAIGTAAGNPDVAVVCITDDGSMLMNGPEISSAVAEHLAVIYVVLNNNALRMVKRDRCLPVAEQIACDLPATDFAGMARALGAQAFTVCSSADFAALDIGAMCRRKGPTLLDVYIDPDEVPPAGLGLFAHESNME